MISQRVESMKRQVRWGVLGCANIAVKKVIPAMQRGEWSKVGAIASRDLRKAQQTAKELGFPKAYGASEDLLAVLGNRSYLRAATESLACSVVNQSR
jgi:hypothetical protein